MSSTTVTREPSASYTVAISRPMIPPPMTSSRSGTSATSSAPVESMTRSSSGRSGSHAALEPAATMQCSKPTVVSPSAVWTVMTFGPVRRPSPRITCTLR